MFSVGYRFALAGVILMIYSKLALLNLKFSLKNHAFIALQGACLFGINYWLVYMAEEHLTSGLVAVIFVGLIFMNVLLSALFLQYPVRKNVIIGGLIGVVGIMLIFKDELRMFDFSDNNFVSFLFAVGSVLLASSGNILSAHNQKQKLPVIQTNAFGMLYGSIIVLSIAMLSGKTISIDLNFSYLSSLAYLSIFGSIVAFTAYLNLLGKIGGDAGLTEAGLEYARRLAVFARDHVGMEVVKDEETGEEKRTPRPARLWTSTLRRTKETAQFIKHEKIQSFKWDNGDEVEWIQFQGRARRNLDELYAGVCDGLTYKEIEEKYPEEFARRQEDKLTYRYPRGMLDLSCILIDSSYSLLCLTYLYMYNIHHTGESYMDVTLRLETIVFDIERTREPILIVGKCL